MQGLDVGPLLKKFKEDEVKLRDDSVGPRTRSPKRIVTANVVAVPRDEQISSKSSPAASSVVRVVNKTGGATGAATPDAARARAAFKRHANDGGAVAEASLSALFRELGFKDKDKDGYARLSRKYCKRYDVNGNGLLEWDEFEQLHAYLCERRGRKKQEGSG